MATDNPGPTMDIVQVVGQHIPLRRLGRGYVGPCPFHEQDRPRFFVSPPKQEFYCRDCFRFGDANHFLQIIEYRIR